MKDELLPNGGAKFQSIFAYAPLGVALVDVDGHPVLNNSALQDILGYSESELQTMSFLEFTHPEDVEKDLNLYQKLMAGEIDSYKMDKRYIKKGGQEVWAQLTVSGIKNAEGKIEYAVGMVNDITETRALQQRLIQTQKMEALGTLAGGIAHDLNNILAAISGHAELSMEQSDASTLNEHLTTILKSTDRATALIQQVLSFSANDSARLEQIDLYEVLKDNARLITASTPNNIDVRWQFDITHAPVAADPNQINQILINLADNAANAIADKEGEINIQLKAQNNDFVLCVTDNGKGMTNDVQQKMFDPFFTTKRIGKGAGLGLAIVDRMVKQHGGHIGVETNQELGTSVSVYIPAVTSDADHKEKRPISDNSLQGHVLVADDEPDLLKLYEAILLGMGFSVVCCKDGADAFETFTQSNRPFDLVITDQAMPRLTGGELTTKIRELDTHTPVIITTGYSDVINEEVAKQLGAAGFFKKPFRRETLKQMVTDVLS